MNKSKKKNKINRKSIKNIKIARKFKKISHKDLKYCRGQIKRKNKTTKQKKGGTPPDEPVSPTSIINLHLAESNPEAQKFLQYGVSPDAVSTIHQVAHEAATAAVDKKTAVKAYWDKRKAETLAYTAENEQKCLENENDLYAASQRIKEVITTNLDEMEFSLDIMESSCSTERHRKRYTDYNNLVEQLKLSFLKDKKERNEIFDKINAIYYKGITDDQKVM